MEMMENDLRRVLELRRKQAMEVDGFCSVFAYRRLLNTAHYMRMMKYESGTDYTGEPHTWGRVELLLLVDNISTLCCQLSYSMRCDDKLVFLPVPCVLHGRFAHWESLQ